MLKFSCGPGPVVINQLLFMILYLNCITVLSVQVAMYIAALARLASVRLVMIKFNVPHFDTCGISATS